MRIKKIIWTFIVVVLLTIVVRIAVGESCYIPSASMEPTIMTGDWLFVDKFTYGGRLPERWADIPLVNVFTHIEALRMADANNNWGYHRLPGFKRPKISDIVVFNSPENEEALLVKRITNVLYIGNAGYYYVTGDNSENSLDSRSFGYIPEQLIIGKINTGIISIDRSEDGNFKLRRNRFFFKIE